MITFWKYGWIIFAVPNAILGFMGKGTPMGNGLGWTLTVFLALQLWARDRKENP